MLASLYGVGSQIDISSLLILPQLSFLHLKFEYFMTHFCMCFLNHETINSNLWNFELLLSWSLKREKLVIQKRGGKSQENFATASRERKNVEAAFPPVGLLLTRGKGRVCVWSETVMSTIMAVLLRNWEVFEHDLFSYPSILLLKPQHVTKLQVCHAVGISRWGQWLWDRTLEDF